MYVPELFSIKLCIVRLEEKPTVVAPSRMIFIMYNALGFDSSEQEGQKRGFQSAKSRLPFLLGCLPLNLLETLQLTCI
jgi:hypothetical protein